MLDGTLMLRVNLGVVGIIYSQSKKFGTGVKVKAPDNSKLNDSPGGVKFLVQGNLKSSTITTTSPHPTYWTLVT